MVSLEDTEHIVRQAGVEAVTKIVRRGDDFVIKRLMETRCQHEDRKIRAVAMQVLQGRQAMQVMQAKQVTQVMRAMQVMQAVQAMQVMQEMRAMQVMQAMQVT